MASESEIIVQEYAKNPLKNYKMANFTVEQHEGNFICGDDITVYLKIKDGVVEDYSFDGNTSTITLAAASFLSEFIILAKIDEVLTWNYQTMVDRGFEVSNRRRRAAVIAMMAARNAIHNYLNDGQKDVFADLIGD